MRGWLVRLIVLCTWAQAYLRAMKCFLIINAHISHAALFLWRIRPCVPRRRLPSLKLQRPAKAASAVSKPKAAPKALSDSESSEDETLSQRHARLKQSAKKSKQATTALQSAKKKKNTQISDDDDDDEIMHVATVKETHAERAARNLAEAKAKGDFMDLGDDDDGIDAVADGAAGAAGGGSVGTNSNVEPSVKAEKEVRSSAGASAEAARVYNAVCIGSAATKTTSEVVAAIVPPLPLAIVKFHLYELTAKGKLTKVCDFPPTWQIE